MAKRWAICKMGEYDEPGFIVPKFNVYGANSRIWSKDGLNWCFGQVAHDNIAELQADPDIYVLPDGSLDMSVGSIPSAVRTTMRNRLEAAGFAFSEVKTTWTVRQVLNYLARQLQPGMDVDSGDVQDVASV